jgi:hypothetical protein
MEALLLVAERNGPTMLALIGMMKALNRHAPVPSQGKGVPDRALGVLMLTPVIRETERMLDPSQSMLRIWDAGFSSASSCSAPRNAARL